MEECPDSAKEGETVNIRTRFVKGEAIHISVDGREYLGAFRSVSVYEFIMPEKDIKIAVWSVPVWTKDDSSDDDDNRSLKGEEDTTKETRTYRIRKKKSTSSTTQFDPDDHDIEGYYEDNKDEFDDIDDAYDAFEDDEDDRDDY